MDCDNLGLKSLPDEIILQILKNDTILMTDVCRLQQTCSRFYSIAQDDSIWENKFKNRWPLSYDVAIKIEPSNGWRAEFIFHRNVELNLFDYIDNITTCLYKKNHLTTYIRKEINDMLKNDEKMLIYMISSLCCVAGIHENVVKSPKKQKTLKRRASVSPRVGFVNTLPDDEEDDPFYVVQKKNRNLTRLFYASCILHHLQILKSKGMVKKFIDLPVTEQSYEKAVYLLSIMLSPFEKENYSEFQKQIGELAKSSIHLVPKTHCIHRISKRHENQDVTDKDWPNWEALQEHSWTMEDAEYVLIAVADAFINNGLFEQTKESISSCKVNEILKKKKGCIRGLHVIFIAICRKLGLHLTPAYERRLLWFPDKEGYHMLGFVGGITCFEVHWTEPKWHINRQNEDRLTKPRPVDYLIGYVYEMVEILSIGHSTSILSLLWEIILNIDPTNRIIIARYISFYKSHGMNYGALYDEYKDMVNMIPPEICNAGDRSIILKAEQDNLKPVPVITKKPRSEETKEVKFAVGCLFEHKLYKYFCVTVGWDACCDMPDTWKRQMRVFNLKNKDRQPFYNVLGNDGSFRYVAQENLIPTTKIKVIKHDDIGVYFKEVKDHYYLPNEGLASEYPDDDHVRNKFIKNLLIANNPRM